MPTTSSNVTSNPASARRKLLAGIRDRSLKKAFGTQKIYGFDSGGIAGFDNFMGAVIRLP